MDTPAYLRPHRVIPATRRILGGGTERLFGGTDERSCLNGYPKMDVEGVPLRDRVWLSLEVE
jgi:hypothetical protein